MRPIASYGGGVLDSSRAGLTSTSEAAHTLSTRTQVLRCHPSDEATSIRVSFSGRPASGGGGKSHMSMKVNAATLSFKTSSEDSQDVLPKAGTVESASVV